MLFAEVLPQRHSHVLVHDQSCQHARSVLQWLPLGSGLTRLAKGRVNVGLNPGLDFAVTQKDSGLDHEFLHVDCVSLHDCCVHPIFDLKF